MPSGTIIRLPDLSAGTRVRRRPGRPRKVVPVIDQDDYTARIDQARHGYILADPLVQLGPDARPIDVVDAVIVGVAQETAALAYEAARAESEGRDASQTRSRRIKALLQLAGVVQRQGELRREQGVLDENTLARVQGLFLAEVAETAQNALNSDAAGEFMEKLEAWFGG